MSQRNRFRPSFVDSVLEHRICLDGDGDPPPDESHTDVAYDETTNDTTMVVYGPDGEVDSTSILDNDTGIDTTTYPDGTVVVDEPDGTVTTTSPDHEIVISYPDGSESDVHPDGSIDYTRPGETGHYDPGTGETTTTQDDGTIIVQGPDDTTTTEPDGTVTVMIPDGDTTVTHPDGSTDTTHNDGSMDLWDDQIRVHVSADGKTKTEVQDGHTFTDSNGTETVIPQITATTTTASSGAVHIDVDNPLDPYTIDIAADGTMTIRFPSSNSNDPASVTTFAAGELKIGMLGDFYYADDPARPVFINLPPAHIGPEGPR